MKKMMTGFIADIFISGVFGCQTTHPNTYKDPLDLSARDISVSPAHNFFEYANGTWLNNRQTPADTIDMGGFLKAGENLSKKIKMILDPCSGLKNQVPGSPAEETGDLYAGILDTTAMNKTGISSLPPDRDV